MSQGNIDDQDLQAAREATAAFAGAQARVAAAEAAMHEARDLVLERLRVLAQGAESLYEPDLRSFIRHLYWQQPAIAVQSIADAAGVNQRDIRAAAGTCPSGVPCSRCGADVPRTSRSWKPPGFKGPMCADCKAVDDKASRRSSNISALRQIWVAKTRVYARAGDWRATAALVVAYPPVGMGISRGSEDDERNGIWLGWENARSIQEDLLRHGYDDNASIGYRANTIKNLVKQALDIAGWDVSRAVDLIAPFTEEPAHLVLTRLKRNLDETVANAKLEAASRFPDDYEPSPEEERGLWDQPRWWY